MAYLNGTLYHRCIFPNMKGVMDLQITTFK